MEIENWTVHVAVHCETSNWNNRYTHRAHRHVALDSENAHAHVTHTHTQNCHESDLVKLALRILYTFACSLVHTLEALHVSDALLQMGILHVMIQHTVPNIELHAHTKLSKKAFQRARAKHTRTHAHTYMQLRLKRP